MNNVFDFRRFGRYFIYDLSRAWYNSGISALVIGMSPIIIYIFGVIFHLLGISSEPTSKVTLVMLSVIVLIYALTFPAKLYGEITDRRAGSNFLMVPSSTCEKFISLILIVLVVVPLFISILFCASDLLLGMVPSYGPTLHERLAVLDLSDYIVSDEAELTDSLLTASSIEQMVNFILFFTLGTLLFKKKKTGKSILSYVLVVTVLVLLIGGVVCLFDGSITVNISRHYDLNMSMETLTILTHTINLLITALLGFFICRRLKKIQL